MPELPEVETIRMQLEKLIVGRKILGIDDSSLKEAIGAKITKIARRAKLIQIFLDNGKILVIHLKLTGRLLVREKTDPKDDWQRITVSLADGLELRFADLRKFGWIKITNSEELITNNEFIKHLGPEALEISLKEFERILAASRRPVKVVLMDQEKISGIGNIYAADALNLARIDPRIPARQLDSEATGRLHGAILKVLKLGIKYGGASDQFYLDAKGEKGHYQEHFLVYNRQGEKCFNCGGLIKKIRLAGRGTYFCPECQK